MSINETLDLFSSCSTTELNTSTTELGGDGDNPISNTKLFLIEENENFDLTAEDEFVDAALDTAEDPSNPPEKGENKIKHF